MKKRRIEIFYSKRDHMGYEFCRRVVMIVGDLVVNPGDIRIEIAARARGPNLKEQGADPEFTMAEWHQITQRIKVEIDGLIEKTVDVDHNKEAK